MSDYYSACEHCGQQIKQEGKPWRHVGTGNFSCGTGTFAEPHECPDRAELEEELREELFDAWREDYAADLRAEVEVGIRTKVLSEVVEAVQAL